jgi:hypothetical protein
MHTFLMLTLCVLCGLHGALDHMLTLYEDTAIKFQCVLGLNKRMAYDYSAMNECRRTCVLVTRRFSQQVLPV